MTKCTWRDCDAEAKHPQKDKVGKEWANFCDEHDKELTDAIKAGDVRKILQCWVKASGGAEKLVKRIYG